MVQINNSYLLGLYGGVVDLGAASPSAASAATKRTDPTPPWSSTSSAPKASELVKRALAGRPFIDLNAAQLDVKGASQDYRKLFALYQGLNALHGLAERMDARNVGALEQSQIARRFDYGLNQVADFVDDAKFDNFAVSNAAASSLVKGTVGMKRTTAEYVGAVIHEGTSTEEVAALQGDVRFSMTVQKSTTLSNGTVINVGGPVTVNIDLAGMGSTPRTLAAVKDYVNGELAAANLSTRFATERTAGAPKTVTVGGKTVTLSATEDRYALKLKGTTGEQVTFAAPDRADAVYVVQQANTGDAAKSQLLKFQSDQAAAGTPAAAGAARPGETFWVEGRSFQVDMGAAVETARAVATGADGSVYVLADVDGEIAGQTIKGERDVALIKYDSAGRMVYARTLGAQETASGYALSVSADGKVAVAGSVTGALNKGDDGLDGARSDGFVSVFDVNGDEVWTARRGARTEDEALAVSFGADGAVYVAGRARSAVPGGVALGGWDGYVQAFAPPTAAAIAATKTGTPEGVGKFGVQFGTTGEDRATAMAMDGGDLVVAGLENGRAVVRRYALQASGPPVLTATRDLGEVQGGGITGVAVQDGRVIVTGSSGNPGFAAGATGNGHAGGADAFVLALEGDLSASANDRLTWFGGAGADNATAATVTAGGVWISGTSPSTLPAQGAGTTVPAGTVRNVEGWLARVNPLTGAVEYEKRFNAEGNTAAPRAIAVAAGGASVLDRLGLPQGTLDYSDSQRVVAGTSARAGDRFYVEGKLGRKAVTIEISDTLATLAKKIERASGFTVTVTVAKDVVKAKDEDDPDSAEVYGALERLQLKPRDSRNKVEITAGDLGVDALAALGIEESIVREAPDTLAGEAPLYGLKLSRNLRLDSKAAIKDTVTALEAALSTVRTAYRDLVAAGKPKTPGVSGPVPAYLQNQLANYQAALDRLGG